MAPQSTEFAGTVLVSAGASGIGRVVAEAFLSSGAAVHICDISADNIEQFLEANPGASATVADVSEPAQVDRVFSDLIERHDRLNVLVNNAGIAGPTAAVENIEVEDWDACIGVDLNGVFYMTRRAVPLLKQARGGSIVNIASTAALFGYPLRSPYVAAKWALIGLTKTWAMELGPDGIRVNAICPGSVSGERIDGVIEREAQERGVSRQHIRDVYLRQTSMRTFVSAEDVANMILFVTSDGGANISGQSIAIDGNTESLAHRVD